jgi:uncharacterized membrane protein
MAPWLLLVTLVGAVLRIVGIDKGLWWDEIYFLVTSVRKPMLEILTVFPGDNQHPLYTILARLSMLTFGEHAWSIRLPALIFGIAAIPALYLLAATVAPRVEALLAAAFLAVSYHHVWFSQNARGYTMLAFWAILSTYFLLRGIRTGRRGPYLAYALTAALGMYTHLTMAFLLVSHGLILAGLIFGDRKSGVEWKKWKYALQAFGIAAILTLLLYAPILAQVQNFFLHKPSAMRAVSTPKWALSELLRVLSLGLGTWAVLVGAAIFAIGGAWSYFRQNRLAFAFFVLPVLVTAGGAFMARGTMYPRFYFSLIGFAVVILIRGLFTIPRWFAGRASAPLTALLAMVLLAGSAYSLVRNYQYPKQDFEGAMRFIESNAKPGDTIITAGATTYPVHQYYAKPWGSVDNAGQLLQLCHDGRPVWLMYTFPRYLEAAVPGAADAIRKDFTIVRVFPGTLGDGDVYVARYPRN